MKILFTISSDTNGRGPVVFRWQQRGNYLACAGVNKRVHIYDRHGKLFHQIPLESMGEVLQLEWDRDGEVLSILQANSTVVLLFKLNTRKVEHLDTKVKDLSFMQWSTQGPYLAIGSGKGTLLIYNRRSMKLIPVKGKHTKRITCGAWSPIENAIALGSSDMQITMSDIHGDTIEQVAIDGEPYQIEFQQVGAGTNSSKSVQDRETATISANVGGKQLWLFDYKKHEEVTLTFDHKYGPIHQYRWFGDGYAMIGFKSGYICVVSTREGEVGAEIGAAKMHHSHLGGVTYSECIRKGASIGDDCVKVFDMTNLKSFNQGHTTERHRFEDEYGTLMGLEWTSDGQILTVSSENGNIYSFLTSIPSVNDCAGSSAVYLSSLRELCVKDIIRDEIRCRIEIDIEPSFVSLGENHVAICMNNRVWYYSIQDKDELERQISTQCIRDREYFSTVQQVKMNAEFVVVLAGGRAIVQKLDSSRRLEEERQLDARDEVIFPEPTANNEGAQVTGVYMNDQFVIFCTNRGSINIFSLEDWTMVSEFRFEVDIQSIFPNRLGTRIIFVDETHAAYMYNPVDDVIVPIERFPGSAERVLWDLTDPSTFVVVDKKYLITYAYSPMTKNSLPAVEVVKQPDMNYLQKVSSQVSEKLFHDGENVSVEHQYEQLPCRTDRPDNFQPMLYVQGRVICQTPSGALGSIILRSHDSIIDMETRLKKRILGYRLFTTDNPLFSASFTSAGTINTETVAVKCFYQLLNLFKFQEAWNLAQSSLRHPLLLEELATRALHHVDIETAIHCNQILGNAAMVLALEKILQLDEVNVILGNIALLQKNFAEAETKFLQSSEQIRALELRRDLMSWDRALHLAEELDHKQIPFIAREYAQQLEIKGEYDRAKDMYERAMNPAQEESTGEMERNVSLCSEGIARCAIRLGDFRLGLQIAMRSDNKKFCRECAVAFEETKQFNEAAQMYVRSDMFERAAEIYIMNRNYKQFIAIMSNIKNPKIFLQFAKAREKEGKYQDAMQGYELAKDTNNVVRLLLEKLNKPSRAIEIVKQNKSSVGAAMIAKICLEKREYKRAIEFYFMADLRDKAFEIAAQFDEMDTYAMLLKRFHQGEQEPAKKTKKPEGNVDDLIATKASSNGNEVSADSGLDLEDDFLERATLQMEHVRQDFLKIAKYYESNDKLETAADYYAQSGEFDNALHLYIQCASLSSSLDHERKRGQGTIIDKAINIVGKVKDDDLTHRLVDFLMSDLEGVAHRHIFKLYMELGNFNQAVHTALMLSKQEQDAGNYVVAHNVLFDTFSQLQEKKQSVPSDLKHSLLLLHSYVIIKDLVPLNEPLLPAKMLLRVAKNVSRFPQHIVPILTSTVIQAYKASLKKSALEYATMLVHPDYLSKIDPRYKKTISQIVRKRNAIEMTDADEPKTPCPFCNFQLPASELDCPQCKNHIPFCIITGQHMVRHDCAQCPSCSFPALHHRFVAAAQQHQSYKCPMCTDIVNPHAIKKLGMHEAEQVLRMFALGDEIDKK